MPGLARRRPFPYDLVFDGHGLMLGRGSQNGPLVASKPQDLDQVAPNEFGYSAMSPKRERTQPYEDLSLGMGLSRQREFIDRRYAYTLNADFSVSGQGVKGPLLGNVTPSTVDATNGITHFFEIGGVLHALNGRYVHKRTSDLDWNTARKDFGSGNAATDVVDFWSNGEGIGEYAYIAMGDDYPIFRYDGDLWQQSVSATPVYAGALCIVGRDLYRSNETNYMSKVDTAADPFDEANWGNEFAFRVGDKTSAITRMTVTSEGTLLVFKTNGIYTLDADGQDRVLFPFLRFAPDADNGKAFGAWLNHVYVTFREGTFRIDPSFGIEQIGPERMVENESPVKGRITAMAGHDTFNLYAGIYNPDTETSYLLKFGGWLADKDGTLKRIEAWHGSITAAFAGKKILSLYQSTVGAPTGHSRLYCGFSDGTVSWFTLPCTPNPYACDEYHFSSADGELYLPTCHFLFASDEKNLRGISIQSTGLTDVDYIQPEYKVNQAAVYTAALRNAHTSPLDRIDVEDVRGSLIDIKFVLKTATTNARIKMIGCGVHNSVRTRLILLYEFMVLAYDGLIRRDGGRLRMTTPQIRDLLRDAAGPHDDIEVVFPDEETKKVSIIDYSEAIAWDDRLRKWRSAVKVTAIEQRDVDTNGIYESLEAMLYSDLETLTYAQMETL
jgi:hypothetical protein